MPVHRSSDRLLIHVRAVVSGSAVQQHPKYNKGLAFSEDERDQLYLRGLLPPAVLSQELQVERVMINVRSKANDLERSVLRFTDTHRYLHDTVMSARQLQPYSMSSCTKGPTYPAFGRRHGYLMGLQDRNERLFFKVLMTHTQELLPIVDLPVRLMPGVCTSNG